MENERIKFYEQGHLYLLDDWLIIPCVSDILSFIFPDKYEGVPKWILENKARYGTIVHKVIQDLEEQNLEYINVNDIYVDIAQEQYKRLKKEYKIDVLSQEQIIHYKDEYAGRLDMIALVNKKLCLIDIKTTAELDLEYLSWQLSLYELAFGKRFSSLYCLWLPKSKEGKLVKIKRKTKKEILEKLGEFKKWKN